MFQRQADEIQQAAMIIAGADALVIGAGAGMGVDSGLPDFRGRDGFWRAYPPFARLGLDFASLASPHWFVDDPALAWGFYGHRLMLYRRTVPHEGFAILRRLAGRARHGSFVITSNVDGQFTRAGFDEGRMVEAHGTLDMLQCLDECCSVGLFPSASFVVEVDPATMRAVPPLPSCARCGSLARPNVLMFSDWGWDASRTEAQHRRFGDWLQGVRGSKVAIIECGAGTAIPTVRRTCEGLAEQFEGGLVRINPHEPAAPAGHVSLPLGALAALRAIEEQVAESTRS